LAAEDLRVCGKPGIKNPCPCPILTDKVILLKCKQAAFALAARKPGAPKSSLFFARRPGTRPQWKFIQSSPFLPALPHRNPGSSF
jgi:hypothetical protein